MNCYEHLANAIIERAVDDYITAVRKLHYLKNHPEEVMKKILETDKRKIRPIRYTEEQLQAEYNRKVRSKKADVLNLENFFGSPWYCVLTKVDGKGLLDRVKEMIKEEHGIVCDLL